MIQLGGVNLVPAMLGIALADISTYFTIETFGDGTANGTYPLMKNGTAYRVTNGKTFESVAMAWVSSVTHAPGAGQIGFFQLVSGTSAIARADTTVTGGVYQYGATRKYGSGYSATGIVWYAAGFRYSFTSQVYPGIEAAQNNSGYVGLLGREV